MNLTKAIRLTFVFSFCVSAQVVQPLPAPTTDEILKRQVRQWVVDRDDTFANLITHSLVTAKTPGICGFCSGAI